MMEMTNLQMKTVERVIDALAEDYAFDIYDADDIGQEIYLISLDLLPKYEEDKGELYPFLLGAVKNRLISFKREKYCNPKAQISEQKLAILHTTDIYETDLIDYNVNNYIKEYDEHIDQNIPCTLREDYMKLKEGLTISAQSKQKILEYVGEVIRNIKKYE